MEAVFIEIGVGVLLILTTGLVGLVGWGVRSIQGMNQKMAVMTTAVEALVKDVTRVETKVDELEDRVRDLEIRTAVA